ncbi:hypothetical protein [Thermicanus aegyptius]|uniref:hypothetical protein n=1 Tax=Thermicanus aegyptius TaxID=94009 RepID=UPI00048FF27C|nr:hypothetical protein [Thermicanus aegyptius]
MENINLIENFIESLESLQEDFEISVALPNPSEGVTVGAENVAVSLRSLANELQRFGYKRVKGMRVHNDKLIVTLEGPDPRPERVMVEKRKSKPKPRR